MGQNNKDSSGSEGCLGVAIGLVVLAIFGIFSALKKAAEAPAEEPWQITLGVIAICFLLFWLETDYKELKKKHKSSTWYQNTVSDRELRAYFIILGGAFFAGAAVFSPSAESDSPTSAIGLIALNFIFLVPIAYIFIWQWHRDEFAKYRPTGISWSGGGLPLVGKDNLDKYLEDLELRYTQFHEILSSSSAAKLKQQSKQADSLHQEAREQYKRQYSKETRRLVLMIPAVFFVGGALVCVYGETTPEHLRGPGFVLLGLPALVFAIAAAASTPVAERGRIEKLQKDLDDIESNSGDLAEACKKEKAATFPLALAAFFAQKLDFKSALEFVSFAEGADSLRRAAQVQHLILQNRAQAEEEVFRTILHFDEPHKQPLRGVRRDLMMSQFEELRLSPGEIAKKLRDNEKELESVRSRIDELKQQAQSDLADNNKPGVALSIKEDKGREEEILRDLATLRRKRDFYVDEYLQFQGGIHEFQPEIVMAGRARDIPEDVINSKFEEFVNLASDQKILDLARKTRLEKERRDAEEKARDLTIADLREELQQARAGLEESATEAQARTTELQRLKEELEAKDSELQVRITECEQAERELGERDSLIANLQSEVTKQHDHAKRAADKWEETRLQFESLADPVYGLLIAEVATELHEKSTGSEGIDPSRPNFIKLARKAIASEGHLGDERGCRERYFSPEAETAISHCNAFRSRDLLYSKIVEQHNLIPTKENIPGQHLYDVTLAFAKDWKLWFCLWLHSEYQDGGPEGQSRSVLEKQMKGAKKLKLIEFNFFYKRLHEQPILLGRIYDSLDNSQQQKAE